MNTRQLPLLLFSIFITSFTCNATDYYVSNSGNNNNDGSTPANAFLTIQHAADLVAAGDTVFVENGTYTGFDLRNTNGTSENPIVFKATGNSVIINQSGPNRADGINVEGVDYVTIDGFIANNMQGNGNGIRIVLSDHCIVRNCSCDNNAERGIFTGFTDDVLIENNICTNSIDEHGIYVSNSSDRPVIRYNECYGNNRAGIHMNGDLSSGGDGIISDAVVYGNKLHDNNGSAGINMDGLENPIIYNNLIYNNHACQGIVLFKGDGAIVTSGAKIYNNTIIVPTDGRWGILVKNGGNVNTEIYNNIIINQHSWRGSIAVENTDNFTCDYNIVNDKMSNNGDGERISLEQWQELGFDSNSLLADDLTAIFINPEQNNFELADDSQAINNGTRIVNSIVTIDINKNTRTVGQDYDIGAYTYASTLSITKHTFPVINIYPNPASEYIIVNNDKLNIKTISLVDIHGKQIRNLLPNTALDISSISAGLYHVRIELENGNYLSKKIIIE